ncbi:hypothetical protein RIEGSTA812A_PEG_414 [invertebrate metagenome]|uniref:Uncharacterized protein n=1 Tax=invertebrate metagenome TaxID=1711999 RepID=A0A484H6C3_9ZZZZ
MRGFRFARHLLIHTPSYTVSVHCLRCSAHLMQPLTAPHRLDCDLSAVVVSFVKFCHCHR